jgi:DNA-binding beta-propeller fold protein YncE
MTTARISGRLLLVLVVLGAGVAAALAVVARDRAGEANRRVTAPSFEVDPLWPKPLPNHWMIGSAVGLSVDERDHVWILHRPSSLANNEKGLALDPPTGECCAIAPEVLEFDPSGTLVSHWGGPGAGYEWPQSTHGLTVDRKGNVWIGGNGDSDAQVLKFTRAGRFVMQVGRANARRGPDDAKGRPTWVLGGSDPGNFGRAAKVFIDEGANEAYVADGYLNRRVAVIDVDSGTLKRFWGAYGNKPDDRSPGTYDPDAPPSQQFQNPVHCADVSNDGFVYVCDRQNDRLQVFRKDGTFVKETFISRRSLADGSVWDVAFSKDPAQTYLYVADGRNMRIHVLRRETLEELISFGDGGRQPGQFYGVHNIATDSKGNIYTTETYEGKRLQKFVFKGVREMAAGYQGTPWPKP